MTLNKSKGGFRYKKSLLGKGDSEFFEILNTWANHFEPETLLQSGLAHAYIDKFRNYQRVDNIEDLKVKIPDFLGIQNMLKFLKNKMGCQLTQEFWDGLVNELEIENKTEKESEKEKETEDKEEKETEQNLVKPIKEDNYLAAVVRDLINNITIFKKTSNPSKNFKYFAQNSLLALLGLVSKTNIGVKANKQVQEWLNLYLTNFGRSCSILDELWPFLNPDCPLSAIFVPELDTFLKEKNRTFDIFLLQLLKESNSFPKSTHDFKLSPENRETCLKHYIALSEDTAPLAKGHRAPGDVWIRLLINDLNSDNLNQDSPNILVKTQQLSRRHSMLLSKYLSERALAKSPYNFNLTQLKLNTNDFWGLTDQMAHNFQAIDLKGNQIETLSGLFFKTSLELNLTQTEGIDSLESLHRMNIRSESSKNLKNFQSSVLLKTFWRIEEFQLYGRSIEESYLQAIMLLSFAEQQIPMLAGDKQRRVEAFGNCVQLWAQIWGTSGDSQDTGNTYTFYYLYISMLFTRTYRNTNLTKQNPK